MAWSAGTQPPGPSPSPPAEDGALDARPSTLPLRAVWLGAVGIVVGFILGGAFQGVALAVFPGSTAAQILLGEIGLWCGLGGTCVAASRRFGTGSLVQDFGWRLRWQDLVYGPVAAGACVLVAASIGAAFHGTRFAGSNTDIITSQKGNSVGVAVVTLLAAVGAPVFEELFFRGFLRQVLGSRFGWGAIWVQAALFGLAHYQFGLGLGNVSVCTATAGIGVVLGYTAYRTGRLGPDTIAHGLFNLFVTLTIIGVVR